MKASPLVIVACAALSCAPAAPPSSRAPNVELVGPGGHPVDLPTALRASALTVIVFYSPHCRCFAVHEPRLRALSDAYRSRGVQVLLVDSEVGGTRADDDREAAARGFPFPILLDRGARLADALGAEYATASVILDSEGRVRYRGGIDSDRTHLRGDAARYLRDALDDLLSGRAPRLGAAKVLGCALEKR